MSCWEKNAKNTTFREGPCRTSDVELASLFEDVREPEKRDLFPEVWQMVERKLCHYGIQKRPFVFVAQKPRVDKPDPFCVFAKARLCLLFCVFQHWFGDVGRDHFCADLGCKDGEIASAGSDLKDLLARQECQLV